MNTLVKYRPSMLGTTNSFLRDFDRMLEGFFGDVDRRSVRTPAVDIREEEDRYVLEAELAGLSEKDVEVKVHDNLLTVSSHTEEDKKDEEKNGYILRERRSASFMRSFVLPENVDRNKIDASFSNGVLTLVLHKVPESKPRTIKVEAK